jgi:hypothetical protein
MPILNAPPPPEAELGQGDLLAGVSLFETSEEGTPRVLNKTSGALVLSRDCAAVNKPRVIVAAVFPAPLDFEREDDPAKRFASLQRHLANLRDGGTRPDRFYLGSLPNQPDRLFAHLDQLSALTLPDDATRRANWLRAHRVARLDDDFKSAIPVRLFWAFGRVGFDDIHWYSTHDLKALVTAGEGHLHQLRAELHEAELQVNLAAGGEAKRVAGLQHTRDARAKSVAALDAELERYRAELRRRE